MTSTWTQNQIIAAAVGFFLCLVLYGSNEMLGLVWEEARDAFAFLSVKTHFSNIARGVIDTRDIVYYASLISVALVISVQSLQARSWK